MRRPASGTRCERPASRRATTHACLAAQCPLARSRFHDAASRPRDGKKQWYGATGRRLQTTPNRKLKRTVSERFSKVPLRRVTERLDRSNAAAGLSFEPSGRWLSLSRSSWFFLWLDELVDTTFNRVALVRVELAISGRCRTSIGVGEAICNYLHSVPLKGGPGNLSQVVPGI